MHACKATPTMNHTFLSAHKGVRIKNEMSPSNQLPTLFLVLNSRVNVYLIELSKLSFNKLTVVK